jgi:hypothetical protein
MIKKQIKLALKTGAVLSLSEFLVHLQLLLKVVALALHRQFKLDKRTNFAQAK